MTIPHALWAYLYYKALAKKLHHLPMDVLIAMHKNISFNVHQSLMKEALHCLSIPPRRERVQEIMGANEKLIARHQQSEILQIKLRASRVIYRVVMVWYAEVSRKNNIKRKLEAEIERKRLLDELENAADDLGF